MLKGIFLALATLVLQPRVPSVPEVISTTISGRQEVVKIYNPLSYSVDVDLSCGYDWELVSVSQIGPKAYYDVQLIAPEGEAGTLLNCRVASFRATKK